MSLNNSSVKRPPSAGRPPLPSAPRLYTPLRSFPKNQKCFEETWATLAEMSRILPTETWGQENRCVEDPVSPGPGFLRERVGAYSFWKDGATRSVNGGKNDNHLLNQMKHVLLSAEPGSGRPAVSASGEPHYKLSVLVTQLLGPGTSIPSTFGVTESGDSPQACSCLLSSDSLIFEKKRGLSLKDRAQ